MVVTKKGITPIAKYIISVYIFNFLVCLYTYVCVCAYIPIRQPGTRMILYIICKKIQKIYMYSVENIISLPRRHRIYW